MTAHFKAEFVPRKPPYPVGLRLAENDLVWRGKCYRGADQVGKLCRDIGKNGTLELVRQGKTVGIIPDIIARGHKSLVERSDGGFAWVKYRPLLRSIRPKH